MHGAIGRRRRREGRGEGSEVREPFWVGNGGGVEGRSESEAFTPCGFRFLSSVAFMEVRGDVSRPLGKSGGARAGQVATGPTERVTVSSGRSALCGRPFSVYVALRETPSLHSPFPRRPALP